MTDVSRYLKALLSVLIVLQLSCGFQLRGNSQMSTAYNPIMLQADSLQDQLRNRMINALKRAGADLVTTATASANQLQLSLSPVKRQKLVNSSLSGVELVQLSMQLEYRIEAPDGQLLVTQKRIQQSVDVELDSNNVLSHSPVLNKARQQLEDGLIRAMIFQLSR